MKLTQTPNRIGLLLCAAIVTTSAAAADYPTTVNSLGPVMYYRLGETTPNVSDIAINSGTIGALGNGFYINDDGSLRRKPGIVPGSQNGALAATTAITPAPARYVQVPLNPANNPQGPFTAECWVQGDPSLTNNLYVVMCQGHLQNPGNAPNRSGWLLYMDGAGGSSSGQAFDYRMYNHVGLNRSLTINGGGAPILGTHTYHVVVGYDGTNGFMYVDGALVQSAAAPGYFPGTDGNFTVGNRNDLAFTFIGLIGEVAYYTNVLSAADVLSHYQTGTNASSAPGAYSALVRAKNPIMYYQFNEPAFVPANPLLTTANLGSWGHAYDAVIQPGVTMAVDGPSSGGFPAGNKAAYHPGLSSSSGAEYGIYVPNPPINTDPNVGSGCVTFTAWIKRNGPSEDAQGHYNGDFAGILFERGVSTIPPGSAFPASGLCFGGQSSTPLPNNQLRYHWNNTDYTFDAGNAFIVPDQTWSFVAGVFTPSNTVLCLNGVFATNNVANAPLDFSVDNLYFGVDNLSGGGRVMDGAIDEVAIFTNALSAAQLTALYNAAGILPTITSQPQPASTNLYEGQSISYSVAAIGPQPITYQWLKNSAAISGQTTATFSITNLHTSDTASYSVKLTNPSGSVTSSVVSLTVLGGPPILVTQPASVSRYPSGSVTFSASALGSAPITYQWYIGTPSTGVPIDGATNTTYHISLLQPADATNYYVVATNPNGQTPSATATLTLLPVTPNAVAAVVARNPMAYWRLNETNGTVVHDSVGGFDGTFLPSTTPNGLVGPTPTADPPSPAFLGLEAANTAFKFDGNTSDINCQSPRTTVNALTITALIKIRGLPNNNNGGACGVVFTRGTGILGLNLSGQAADGSGGNTLGYTWNNVFHDFGMAPISNAWTFVALVVNASGATMYMDADGTGLQNAVDATSLPAQTIDAPIHLGTDSNGNRVYQGLLDEVAVFDHALTPEDIGAIHDAIYNNTYSPIPPTFIVQPVSRTMFAGSSFTLTGVAAGSQPLTYQWTKNNVNIPNAIRGSISFVNSTTADSGTYQLVVSQGATVVKSTPAVIQVVTPAPGSYAASVVAAKPLAYWRLNETTGTTAVDSIGSHDGTVVDNVTLGAPAPVPPQNPGFEAGNKCYAFDGIDSYVALPDNIFPYPVSGTGNSPFSFEALFKTTTGGVILGQQTAVPPAVPSGYVPAVRVGTDGLLYVSMFWANSSTGGPESPVPVNDGRFHHLAVTYNGTSQVVYLDGVIVSTKSFNQTSFSTFYHYQLGTGYNGAWSGGGANWFGFDGAIDEVALYDRPLTADEVLASYSAAFYGSTTAPFVTLNPSSQTLIAGDSVSLRAAVMGSLPISYQWKKDGVNVPGATVATLSLTNVLLTDAGSYVLWATNGVGHINTTAATLTVIPQPAYVNLTNNLILHLKFDGDFTDTSVNANDATPHGNPTFVTDGQIGKAARLSNVNWLAVPDANGSYVFTETDDFTVSFWVRYTTPFSDLPIIGTAINSTYRQGWVFAESGNARGKIMYSLCDTPHDGSGANPYVADPVPGSPLINDNAWHNVVGVVDRMNAALATVYVDGALAGSWSIVDLGNLISAGGVTIAQDPTGTYGVAGTFDLDDVGIWHQVIDPISARSIYFAGKAGHSFDVPAPAITTVTLGSPRVVGGNVTITWTPAAGTLYASPAIAGPAVNWVPVGSGGSVTLPLTTTPRFFKVAQ